MGAWATSVNGGTVALSTTDKHFGLTSALTNGVQTAGEYAFSYANPVAETWTELYGRHYTKVLSAPNAGFMGLSYPLLAFFGYNQPTSQWCAVNVHTSTFYYQTGTSVFYPNKWYCIECHVIQSETLGVLELWVDGNKLVTATGLDLGPTALSDWNFGVYLQANNAGQRNVYVDDAIVAQERIGCGNFVIPQTRTDNRPHQLGRVFQYRQ